MMVENLTNQIWETKKKKKGQEHDGRKLDKSSTHHTHTQTSQSLVSEHYHGKKESDIQSTY